MMLQLRPGENGGTLRTDPTANLFAGGVGGLSSLVVGYPFDTVKVRLQSSQNCYRHGWDCFKTIVRNNGATAVYRGISGLAATSIPR